MADSKKPKLERMLQAKNEVKIRLLSGLQFLFSDLYRMLIIKITSSNGDRGAPFTEASCSVEEHDVIFPFSIFFQPGIKMLCDFLRTGDTSRLSDREEQTLECLVRTFENANDISKSLQGDNKGRTKEDTGIQLAHHLLTSISTYKDYTLDQSSINQTTACVCCGEKILGKYGDTNMGHEAVWHGRTDILMGRDPAVSIKVIPDKEEEEEDGSFPVKPSAGNHKSQLIAEAIVFGFLQNKMNRCAKNILIPTLSISRKHLKVFMYDAKHDILLESLPMYLFRHKDSHGCTSDSVFVNSTLLALWLAMNYPVTCSGLTKSVIETNFKSECLLNFKDDIKSIYLEGLKFGPCRKQQEDEEDDFTRLLINKTLNHAYVSVPNDGTYNCYNDEDLKFLQVPHL